LGWRGNLTGLLVWWLLLASGLFLGYQVLRRQLRHRQEEYALREQDSYATMARYQALVEAAMDAVITVDDRQNIVQFNAAAELMFGHLSNDILGKPLEELLPKRFRAGHGGLVRAFGESGATMRRMGALRSVAGLRANGEEFPVEASISHVKLVATSAYGVILRDVTARQKAEAELIKARDEALQANKAKTEFLSSMSHELRTPLNAILGYAQLLESDPDGTLTVGQQEEARHIFEAGAYLLRLVDDVLSLAKIEEGSLSMTVGVVDVTVLVSECVAMLAPMAAKRSIRWTIATGARGEFLALADRVRLEQILLNLLSNAVKFNNTGGEVKVKTGHSERGAVQVMVSDSGPGIAKELMPSLFEKFSRLGRERGVIEGSGIGLAISKQLTEQMGGQIHVESLPGQGTRIWLDLPRADVRVTVG